MAAAVRNQRYHCSGRCLLNSPAARRPAEQLAVLQLGRQRRPYSLLLLLLLHHADNEAASAAGQGAAAAAPAAAAGAAAQGKAGLFQVARPVGSKSTANRWHHRIFIATYVSACHCSTTTRLSH